MRQLQGYSFFLCQIFLSLLATTFRPGRAQNLESNVDVMVAELLQCKTQISALALSVVKDGQVLLQKGYGLTEREMGTRVDEYTLFGIASLTKAFTTTLLMKILEGQRRISVDTPVSQILGDDFRFSNDLLTKYATLRDLMSHRMGLPASNYIRFQKNLSRKELARRFRYINATGEFRSTYQYNNIVYGLLTQITEVLGNDTWENLMTREIFEPLGMSKTTFGHTIDPEAPNRAVGYVLDRNNELQQVPDEMTRHWGSLGGSGATLSNAVDISQWLLFHLSLGKNRTGHQVAQSATIRENHKPWVTMDSGINKYMRAPTLPATFVVDRYAAAWRNGFYRGLSTISHTGSTYGYRAMAIMYPEQNLGIFVSLSGIDSGVFARTSLLSYIADIVLGYEPWLNETTICTFPEPWTKAPRPSQPDRTDRSIPSERALSAYVGSYENALYGTLDITVNETMNCTNCLRMTYGISTWDLYPNKLGFSPWYPRNRTGHFVALGTDVVFFFSPFNLQFYVNHNGIAQEMLIPYFNYKGPPVFKRIGQETTTLPPLLSLATMTTPLFTILYYSVNIIHWDLF